MLIALSASAAEMWRWKDADGVTHYSDRPVPGAERIQVLSTQKSTGEATPANRPAPAPAPAEVRYTRCTVGAPINDQVFNNVRTVDVSVVVEPQLQPDHQLQVVLNGQAYTGWPANSLSHTLADLVRGSYTLGVRVLDGNGRPQCEGPIVNFHVRLPTVLAPNRRPPAQKP